MTIAFGSLVERSDQLSCAHCALPVPASLVELDARDQFCCNGCKTVFEILHGAGLAHYYVERQNSGVSAKAVIESDKSYAELDDPAFLASFARPAGPGLVSIELALENLHCPACVWLVERLGRLVPGIASASVDYGRSLLRVSWAPTEVSLSQIARTLASLGYPAHPHQSAISAEIRRREDRALLSRLAVAGACFGNTMLMAFALYSGVISGMDREWQQFFRWASLIVALPAVLYSGGAFFRGAIAAFRTRTPHMDLPIAVGIGAGSLFGMVNVVRGSGDVYFDSVTAVIFLLLIGRYLQRRSQQAARSAAELLHSLAPSSARLIEADQVREVSIDALSAGALCEVRAGETFPVDGRLVEGNSAIDARLLTGESRPVDVGPGTEVLAGTVNLAARVVVRAVETGQATRVGRLLRSVDEAASRRPPIALAADRAAARFVLAVLAVALATLLVWWKIDAARGIENAIALLIVTCPCALGLATPLAVTAAIGKAAQRGVLVKGGDALERLARPALFVFDKTGTLTEGRLELAGWEGDAAFKPLVSAIESLSAHPVARALVRTLGTDNPTHVENYVQTPGGGVEASVDGRRVVIGSAAFVAERATLSDEFRERIAHAAMLGETPVVVAVDGTTRAIARLSDPLRPDAARSLDALRKLGHRVAILSGDLQAVVDQTARRLGVELAFARGASTPEQKLEQIEYLAGEQPVVMVGDGVNDAAALARANVGVAVHGGAEASLAAADVFTTRAGVAPVLELAVGARNTLRVIHRNIGLSLAYNTICAALAVTGHVAPWIAAILMPLSSLSVVTASYKSKTFRSLT